LPGISLTTQQSLSPFLLAYPIKWLAEAMIELVNHFPFIQQHAVWPRLGLEQMTIVGHVEFTRQHQIPLALDFLAQKRELEHLLGNADISLILEFHYRKRVR